MNNLPPFQKGGLLIPMHSLKEFSRSKFSDSISASFEFLNSSQLKIEFTWPIENKIKFSEEAKRSERRHELWKTTCFEAFIYSPDSKKYFEINLSPSSHWNVYHFEGYRRPTPPNEAPLWKLVEFERGTSHMSGTFAHNLPSQHNYLIGLTAVIESLEGTTYYLSLKHPGEKPDFHNPDGYVLERTTP